MLPLIALLGVLFVPLYQISFVKRATQNSRLPEFVECFDDQEAIQKAMQFVDGHDVTLLDGSRLVTRFPGTQQAEARGGELAAGIIGGIAAGAIIGSVANNGYYGPGYYAPGYGYGPNDPRAQSVARR